MYADPSLFLLYCTWTPATLTGIVLYAIRDDTYELPITWRGYTGELVLIPINPLEYNIVIMLLISVLPRPKLLIPDAKDYWPNDQIPLLFNPDVVVGLINEISDLPFELLL